MVMKWTEDLSVGVGVIDAQHKELFATADALLEAVGRGEGHGEVTKAVAFLEEYVENHFRMEEMYMKRYSYTGYPEHKIEHTTFIGDFYDMRQELDNNGVTPELTVRLAETLGDWLVNHIGRMDRALGAFLRERR
ncbi:MAG TPA: bacteriohemerythrin [Candidatus Limnocylindria bacterium]|nr:bacteriohemerythrin [Candidatus Limnocylindria bacterium]